MSWKIISKPRTVRVTRPVINEWHSMQSTPNDRPLSERRLMVYGRMMNMNEFRPVSWAKCFCKETGETYRINGKHTSTMLSGLPVVPEFYAVIESYEADTLEDVAKLYATFDSKTQSRTASDINHSFAASVPELRDLPGWAINLCVSGIGYAKYQDQYFIKPAAERAEEMLDHVGFCIWLHEMLGQQTRSVLRRVPVAGAMMLTFQKSKSASTEFWAAVRDETGATPDTPDRKLAKWLSLHCRSRASGVSSQLGLATSREHFAKCLHAWNAWRKKQPTTLRYYADAELPMAV